MFRDVPGCSGMFHVPVLSTAESRGASAAAYAGVSNGLFKRHGRWKTDRAKDGYIKDNLESLLSVSKKFAYLVFFVLFLYFRKRASINEMPAPEAVFVFIKISSKIIYNLFSLIRVQNC